MKMFRVVILIVFAACIFFPVNSTFASAVQDQLKVSLDQMLEILRDPSLKGEESKQKRRAALRIVIYERFDFEKMSKYSLAKHWNKISDEEKKFFVELFGQLLEQTYVSKIESYTNEQVVFVKEYVKKKRAQVNTKILTDTIEIPINYRMSQTEKGIWMIYDVVIENVSLVGNYRSQFDQILQKDSYEKLMEILKKKINS
jgi:phospholipid transport system substrate-binding protein